MTLQPYKEYSEYRNQILKSLLIFLEKKDIDFEIYRKIKYSISMCVFYEQPLANFVDYIYLLYSWWMCNEISPDISTDEILEIQNNLYQDRMKRQLEDSRLKAILILDRLAGSEGVDWLISYLNQSGMYHEVAAVMNTWNPIKPEHEIELL